MGAKRRFDVMLSGTFRDLVQHREAVIAAMNELHLSPLAQEFSAAIPDSDLIKASLDMVDKADAYVGLIGSRYGQRPVCPKRNPEQLSLSELEFRRAVERELPRCTFIMGADHPLTRAHLDRSMAEGADSHAKHLAFIKAAKADRITAEFTSPDLLKSKATTSFVKLRELLELADAAAPTTPAPLPPSPDDFAPTAPPAFHYVRKPYVEKQGFAGRASELALIDRWATGTDTVLLFQAIGGMGKSMLTWHWVKNRAPKVRSDWAGQLWYSFYEQGADLNDFCVHALAYIRRQAPKTFRGRRTLDLGDELRRELDARPWLLILDGLERVLVAYNRAGKEHMTDEEAVVARDGMGLDREPRACFRPEDDDVLAMLAQAGRAKLLASSRLTPTALMNQSGQTIPGVRYAALEGLAPEDAEQMLRNARVRGDGWRMQRFLKENFDCHPLSVGVVAGQVNGFLDARGDFDRWVGHPKGGADPALIAKDLRGRQNHVLARAFDDLDDDAKALLGSIAMASIELTPDVLRILNPMRPTEPKKVDPPEKWTEEQLYQRTRDKNIDQAYRAWKGAKSPDERAAAQEKLDGFREKNFAERKGLYDASYTEWQQKAAEADAWLLKALPGMEARGLLQYDAEAGSLDMHPAIRHTALIGLSPDARISTGSHVSDALSSRPVKPFDEARTREELALGMTRVEALNTAGKLKEGLDLLGKSGLSSALHRLGYGYEQLELIQPYFAHGWEQGPVALPAELQANALRRAVSGLFLIGSLQTASVLGARVVRKELENETTIADPLGVLAMILEEMGQRARAERIRSLAIRVAEADDDEDELLTLLGSRAITYINGGRLSEAEGILATIRDRITNQSSSSYEQSRLLATDLHLALRKQGNRI